MDGRLPEDGLADGLYEELISVGLRRRLDAIDDDGKYVEKVGEVETPSVLAEYAASVIKNGLEILTEEGTSGSEQARLVNEVVSLVHRRVRDSLDAEVADPVEQLKALANSPEARLKKQKACDWTRPETSIATSSLFTGAPREPSLYTELGKEIGSCDSIDLVVSFIRWSGVSMILDELKKFTDSGKKLRIITTSYMGATEPKAIAELARLNNTEIRISYDSQRTRLHAKAYLFNRRSGYSTAYVGSSNLTNPAMTSGCEWNVKISKVDQRELFKKVEASYEGLWNSDDYTLYTNDDYDRLKEELERAGQKTNGTRKSFFFDLRPYPYQEAILERLEAERQAHASYKNLVVAATGTGKTMIAAFDYKRQCEKAGKRLTLLFVAHRKEILEQSVETFREVLKESQFGELYVGGYKPSQIQHLFVSIDMLNQRNFVDELSEKHYDYIVLDECHHAAAKSYQPLLEHFKPVFLLGLTATPERMDGESILPYFNERIAAEIRLPDAINRKLLCPFIYFGVEDMVDLSALKWKRGGYDRTELENVYVQERSVAVERAKKIVNSLERYVADLDRMKGLAFCVSVAHAQFMAEFFNKCGIASKALSGETSESERSAVRSELQTGKVKLVCVVDLYNEGVDIKEINTVLFLRPTESLTVFLQQLGRGLRLADNKPCLTVLDFIGQAHRKYRFYEAKYNALLPSHNPGVRKELEEGFPHLPRGCYVKLEKKAQRYILDNLKYSTTGRNALVERIKTFEEETGAPLTIGNFLTYYHLEPRALYGQKLTLTDVQKNPDSPQLDAEMWKKLYHVATLDSLELLKYASEKLADLDSVDPLKTTERERGYWNMTYSCFDNQKPGSFEELLERLRAYFAANDVYMEEIKGLVSYLRDSIEFISVREELPYENALDVHCAYTRAQILASLDFWKTSSEGVARIEEKKTTCLFVTLNKSNSYYSPQTAYHDYSINSELFHWQSQNATSEDTAVGQRYIRHAELGETILLFVREAKEDKSGSIPFTFLGKASYVKHTGNKPMSITWRLERPIPARFLEVTDKLGVS
ncbi:MAG: DUF3427 domain-containing protein [Thermoguttaceae bacterium]|nr:DUF3427 domain-containing protein [Thermoguttaceae bacterium]